MTDAARTLATKSSVARRARLRSGGGGIPVSPRRSRPRGAVKRDWREVFGC